MNKHIKMQLKVAAPMLLLFILCPSFVLATSGAVKDIFNTEVTEIIDDYDATANLVLQFGYSLNKRLYYDRAMVSFVFNDNLKINGNIRATGSISGSTIHGLGLANCNSTNSTLQYNNTTHQFECGTLINRQTTTVATVDTTINGTNTIAGLSIPVLANSNYIIECTLITNAAATTTGLQTTLNGPLTPASLAWSRQSCSSATALVARQLNTFATEDTRTASAGATKCIDKNTINLQNGVNAGNVTFSLDTEINASAVTVHPGSFCEWRSY